MAGGVPNTPEECKVAMEDLLRRARAGCPTAVAELLEEWAPYLLIAIRQKLDLTPRLRTLFDSMDFLQEVRVSFLAATLGRQVFESVPNFLKFLTVVAQNKVREFQRKFLATEKRSL